MRYWKKILDEVLSLRATENSHFSTNKTSLKPKSSYFLGKNFPGIYLTQREAECMLNFLKRKTVTEAALELNLSPRTVEFYLKNMKTKLECKSKSELIHKVRESDFSKNYLKTSNCEYETSS